MVLHGDFHTLDLPTLLKIVTGNKRTGILTLVKENEEKTLYFKEGEIVSAYSREDDNFLAQILLKKGKITQEQLSSALGFQNETGLPIAKIFMSMGVLKDESVVNELKSITEKLVYHLFHWHDAKFSFVEVEIPEEDYVHFNIDTTDLISRTIEKIEEWEEIKAVLPDRDVILRKREDKLRAYRFPPSVDQILNLIDGTRTVGGICASYPEKEYSILKMLSRFVEQGLLEKVVLSPTGNPVNQR
jgi:hypothetical protein